MIAAVHLEMPDSGQQYYIIVATGTTKWNAVIINASCTRVFPPAMKPQNVQIEWNMTTLVI